MRFPNDTTCPCRELQCRKVIAPRRIVDSPPRHGTGANILRLTTLAALLSSGLAGAQEVSLLVQRSTLAGYRYYEAPAVASSLRNGAVLQLVREADNPHDANAVRVEWQGLKLGYVPRSRNTALAWAMDQGETVVGKVVKVEGVRRQPRRLEFDILMR